MKLPYLRPSVALTVPKNTPILDCIHQMAHRNIGSILIVESREREDLVGIFTERDLLRCFESIKNGVDQFLPISRFMTPDVTTLPLSRLHECGNLMVEKGIRHIVLTYDEDTKNPRIAGIISIRDVFGQLLKSVDQGLEPTHTLPKDVLLISNTDSSRSLLRYLFSKYEKVEFRVIETYDEGVIEKAKKTECLFIDLDHFPAKDWTQLLREVLVGGAAAKRIVVIYNPLALHHQELSVLSTLAEGRRLELLEKPVSIASIIEIVRT